MLDLSVIIVAYNEERIIAKTLAAVAPIASEIILVDSGSTDNTLQIAKKYGAQCHHQQWLGYAAQKNYALSLATKSWILSLDADEVLSDALAAEISTLLQDPLANSLLAGYRIPRLLYIGDTPVKHGGFYPDAQLRLFKNGKGKFIERRVHESVHLDGQAGRLQSDLLHYGYTDFAHYATTLDRYAHLAAQEAASKRTQRNGSTAKYANNQNAIELTGQCTGNKLPESTVKTQIPNNYWQTSMLNETLHPLWTFCYRYFIRAGFLDGTNGLKANLIYQDYVRKKISYLRQISDS